MPYQDDLRRYFGEIARYAEPALTAGSAAIAEPVSGLAGLGALLRGRGVDGAVQSINAAQQAMTYQPRTMEGQQGLRGLQAFLQPVGDVRSGRGAAFLCDPQHQHARITHLVVACKAATLDGVA